MDLHKGPTIVRLFSNDSLRNDLNDQKKTISSLKSNSLPEIESTSTVNFNSAKILPSDDSLNVTSQNSKLHLCVTEPDSEWNLYPAKRSFVKKWKSQFPFIEYDRRKKCMFCKVCNQFSAPKHKSVSFVCGTKNFRLSSIRYHQSSSLHQRCLILAESCSINIEFDADKKKVLNVLKSVYLIMKTKSSFTCFPQLCASQKQQKLKLGPAYTTHNKVVPYFSKYIALSLERELSKKIKHCGLFTLVLEASFSRTVENHKMVFLKFLERKEIRTIFLGIIEFKTVSGKTVYETLSNLFDKFGMKHWVQNLVYIMVDSSSNGHWLEELVHVINETKPNHFVCVVPFLVHKFNEFCAKCKDHFKEKNFREIILQIYLYYSKLPDDEKQLCHIGQVIVFFVEQYGGLPKKSSVTFTFNALAAVNKDWFGLIQLLKQKSTSSDCKSRKLSHTIFAEITKTSFIFKLALYLDVLSCLSTFRGKLKHIEFLPFHICDAVQDLYNDFNKCGKGEGVMFKTFSQELCVATSTFRNIPINFDQNEDSIFNDVKLFIQNLCLNFKNTHDKLSFLNCTRMFGTCNYLSDEDNVKYFNDCYFKFERNLEEIQSAFLEWDALKNKASLQLSPECYVKPRTNILELIENPQWDSPVLTDLLKKVVLLDFSSLEMESGYQEMNLVKSVDRSTLSTNSLHNTMMIVIHGPEVSQYNPSPAFELWLHQCQRRYRNRSTPKNISAH